MRCPTRGDRGQKNQLALSRKLRICINSEKEDNLVTYTQIFENFSWKFPFHLPFILVFPKFSVEWFDFSEIQQFPELFPGNFLTICPHFENFGIFGQMLSALDHSISPSSSILYLTIRLFARDIYRLIVDEGASRVNYHA